MSKAKLFLNKIIQDSQDYGSDDEHMVSRVFFNLEIQGKLYSDLYTNVKQPVGGSFESSPLEVSRPVGYEGPFNYEAFREIIEQYYRSRVGASGRGIHIEESGNIRMRDNIIAIPDVAEFEVPR